MIQRSTTTNVPGIARDCRRHDPAATAAICTAGYRITSAIAEGSLCPRRSAVLSKPADLLGAPMANGSGSCGDLIPPGFYTATFLGVKHEALFEIATKLDSGHTKQIVRMPFADADSAEELAPALGRLLNGGSARVAAQQLHDALARFLAEGETVGVDVAKRAGEVLNALASFRFEIGAD